jgi:8-oxo-dGTP diphosphatase
MKPRLVYTSVTNFLCVGDEYLFLHRLPTKKIDANKLNGIGGKLEHGEDFLSCAIRETEEETGYVVTPSDIRLAGVAKIEGGYEQDWIVCFFKIVVPSKEIPIGNHTFDGELLWLHKDEVLIAPYELVDDLRICFPKIAEGSEIFFLHEFADKNEKIETYTLQNLANVVKGST